MRKLRIFCVFIIAAIVSVCASCATVQLRARTAWDDTWQLLKDGDQAFGAQFADSAVAAAWSGYYAASVAVFESGTSVTVEGGQTPVTVSGNTLKSVQFMTLEFVAQESNGVVTADISLAILFSGEGTYQGETVTTSGMALGFLANYGLYKYIADADKPESFIPVYCMRIGFDGDYLITSIVNNADNGKEAVSLA